MAAPYRNDELLQLAVENNDDDLVFMLLNGMIQPGRVTYNPQWPRFDLDVLSDDQCLEYFRFRKEDITRLAQALGIPDEMICENRARAHATEALCVFLRRLVYPNRLSDMEPMFGRPKTTLSMIVKEVTNFILDRHGDLLSSLQQPWLNLQSLQSYADAVSRKGAPLTNCIGFIDGTVRPICRPTVNQRIVYNGHKRTHALKYQSVVLPNGLIGNLFGPVEGRRHDCALLRLSELSEKMNDLEGGGRFALYGDPAYPIRDWLLSPFKNAHLTDEQRLFNGRMSSVRECVEWQFGKIVNLFAFMDYKKNLKLYLQPVGKLYLAAALLVNCHTCLYGSETSQFFELDPPVLEDYIGNQ